MHHAIVSQLLDTQSVSRILWLCSLLESEKWSHIAVNEMKGTVVGSKVLFANFPSFNGNIQNFAGH